MRLFENSLIIHCIQISVIVARILRKSSRRINNHHIYKIDIVKTYKTSEKAEQYLKQSRLITAPNDGLCGINFSECCDPFFWRQFNGINVHFPQKLDSFTPLQETHRKLGCVNTSKNIQKCLKSRNAVSLELTRRDADVK